MIRPNKINTGIESNIPSILSSIPPWPGRIFPVSFTFANLLKYEINKSPTWHDKDKPKQIKIFIRKKLLPTRNRSSFVR